jgi:hypothetical protein
MIHAKPLTNMAAPDASNEKTTADNAIINDSATAPTATANGTAIGEANNARITSHAVRQFFLPEPSAPASFTA